MKVLVDFSLVPVGTDLSISTYVNSCNKIFQKYGFKINIHTLGTNIEGEWEEVALALEECHKYLHSLGVGRIFTSLKVTSRTDREQHIQMLKK
jgi:uncharacterized protein (TIGR00106 family)